MVDLFHKSAYFACTCHAVGGSAMVLGKEMLSKPCCVSRDLSRALGPPVLDVAFSADKKIVSVFIERCISCIFRRIVYPLKEFLHTGLKCPPGQSDATLIPSQVDSAPCENTTCSPFRLLVIWHTSNGEDSAFIEQKRLIIRMLLKIPQETEVQVTTINTQLNHILHFETNRVKGWIHNISMYSPENLENHTIHRSLINKLVSNFRERNAKKDVADKVLLVVSEITEKEKRCFEIIKNVERLVVFTGRNPPPPLWKSLATNIHYFVTLNTTSENVMSNIHGAAKTVLDRLCQDSRLSCGTDEFLIGKRCISCSYICSEDTKTPPFICRELCPYYKRFTPNSTTIETNKKGTGENTKPTTLWISISSVIFVVLAMLVAKLIHKHRNLTQKTKSDSTPSTLIVNKSQTCKEKLLSNNSYTLRSMSI